MNDVLVLLCERYGMNLQTLAGELSIMAALNMVKRIEEAGKPTRIFYLSDFDPVGQSMPVAMARKLEYFVRTRQVEQEIRLFPLVLAAGQVQEYRLPRTPIKESERRRSGFEQRYGSGATELDALEAIAPGTLARLVVEAVERYYDVDLRWRAMEMELELERECAQRHAEVLTVYAGQHESLKQRYALLQQEYKERLAPLQEKREALWHAIERDLQGRVKDVGEFEPLVGKDAQELGDGLYNSGWEYLEQLEAYRVFRGLEVKP